MVCAALNNRESSVESIMVNMKRANNPTIPVGSRLRIVTGSII